MLRVDGVEVENLRTFLTVKSRGTTLEAEGQLRHGHDHERDREDEGDDRADVHVGAFVGRSRRGAAQVSFLAPMNACLFPILLSATHCSSAPLAPQKLVWGKAGGCLVSIRAVYRPRVVCDGMRALLPQTSELCQN